MVNLVLCAFTTIKQFFLFLTIMKVLLSFLLTFFRVVDYKVIILQFK